MNLDEVLVWVVSHADDPNFLKGAASAAGLWLFGRLSAVLTRRTAGLWSSWRAESDLCRAVLAELDGPAGIDGPRVYTPRLNVDAESGRVKYGGVGRAPTDVTHLLSRREKKIVRKKTVATRNRCLAERRAEETAAALAHLTRKTA